MTNHDSDIPQPSDLPPCPHCGGPNCFVTSRIVVTGLAPVAGVQIKAAAKEVFIWKCPNCELSGHAHPPTDAPFRPLPNGDSE